MARSGTFNSREQEDFLIDFVDPGFEPPLYYLLELSFLSIADGHCRGDVGLDGISSYQFSYDLGTTDWEVYELPCNEKIE